VPAARYRFGPFLFDREQNLLFRGSEVIALAPKVLETLKVLIENRQRLLGKEELIALIWPGQFVEEGNLPQNIFVLRRALLDGQEGTAYIETYPRRGYRFVAAVEEEVTGEAAVPLVAAPTPAEAPTSVVDPMPVPRGQRAFLRPALATLLVLTVVLAFGLRLARPRPDQPIPPTAAPSTPANAQSRDRGAHLEVEQLVREGRFLASQLSDLRRAVALLERAIVLDPQSADAYSALAYARLQTNDLITSPLVAMPAARSEARRALALDPRNAEAQMVLAMVAWQFDWDFVAAEREFARLVEIDPLNVSSFAWQAFMETFSQRPERCLETNSRARAVDASFGMSYLNLGMCFYFLRRHDEALLEFHKMVELDERFWLAHATSGRALEQLGRVEEALAAYRRAAELDTATTEPLMDLGRLLGKLGRRDEARAILAKVEDRASIDYVSPFHRAWIHLGLGDDEAMFAALDEALATRTWYMTWLGSTPEIDAYRDDPRFKELLRRMNAKGMVVR
jgi:DNA-binding winged helix-turn-helix (wHTH) protein/tetratricopeptide (TPR) repeat protein